MVPVYSSWLAAHGKLWYDDKWYRFAWLVWPQALAAALVLLFWAMPSTVKYPPWAEPIDPRMRARQLQTLRDTAKSNRAAMETLGRDAHSGEMLAQFYYATLFDPNFKLSTIVQPSIGKAIDLYSRAADQGDQSSLNNLTNDYSSGRFVRRDYTRACLYARKITNNATVSANALSVRGDWYARGLGDTQVDMARAAKAYEAASNKGNMHASAVLGYFYEYGLGDKPRNFELALKYYRAAADKGDPLGLHNLAFAYDSGSLGLQRNGSQAARLAMRALEERYDVTLQSLTNRPELWSIEFWQSLQRLLEEKGVYAGPIDGHATPATLAAVRRVAGRG
ncbi:MAG: hypothetical protein ACRECL_08610 [Bradyrhizobium sp.]